MQDPPFSPSPDNIAATLLAVASPGVVAANLLLVLVLVLVNAFFVASEFALVSVRRTRIDHLADEGSRSAKVVQHALHDLDRYIAATQVGITIASLLLGGLGHAALEPILEPIFRGIPQFWAGLTSVGVATGFAYFIMTALHVVIGELMPKSIALQNPDVVALWVGRPMTLIARLFTPLIWLLNGAGNMLLRLIGIRAPDGHGQVHSPEELDMLFTQSLEGGEISATEREILHRVVKFSDLSAREVMVPRVEMQGLPTTMKLGELTALLRSQPHTRIPVYGNSMDDIVGMIHLKDMVRFEAEQSIQGDPDPDRIVDLRPLLREAISVPETISIDRMLIEFKRCRQQMAIVIDEYGGTSGLITMGDLLEQAFGDVH
jgi:CBS domain containing-hemolysin-like protein